MKTRFFLAMLLARFRLPALILILLEATAANTLRAATKELTFVGPDGGAWSDPANWSPNKTPQNRGREAFDVRIALDNTDVLLDIDATISKLRLGGDGAQLSVTDHAFTVTGSTHLKAKDRLNVIALNAPSVSCDLGTLANFSGTELLSGGFFVDAAPGATATLRFSDAKIVTNSGRLGLIGAGASIVDQSGANALAGFTTNAAGGFVRFARAYNFTTNADFTNDGYLVVRAGTTATFNGAFADALGPGEDDGLVEVFGTDDPSAGIDGGNGRLVVTGAFSPYDSTTHTLTDGQYGPTTYGDASGLIQFQDADIVTNKAILLILGQNAGFVDQDGRDGLRHLAVNDIWRSTMVYWNSTARPAPSPAISQTTAPMLTAMAFT